MDTIKRTLSFNQSSKEKTKKLRNESIISIENLSDEMFYEIFDYLDGGAISRAFSNLNDHFQQLLNSSSLLFKMKFQDTSSGTTFMNNYQPIVLKRYQIFSIYSWKPSQNSSFLSSFITGASFNRLELLVFETTDSTILMSILSKLKLLPRLFSLTITYSNEQIDLTDIYRIILSLPVLKYYKLSTEKPYLSILLPPATNEQFNTIEHLVIDYCCTFDELFTIICYTPQLRRLNFLHTNEIDSSIKTILPITLSNLTHLSICMYYITFNEFEMFIRKIYSKLKVLCIVTQSEDIAFLDAHRWEQFILHNFPQLEKFHLQYSEQINNEHKYPIYSGGLNQFSSSFWIERQWIMEAEIDGEYITYFVCRHRKLWYEYPEDKIGTSSVDFSKSTRLILPCTSSNERNGVISIDCRRVLSVVQIYHLEISEKKTFIGILIHLICLLPELHSLRIHSLSLDQPRNLSAEELVILSSITNTCKITKIYLEKMIKNKEVDCLISLCPYLTYLKVDSINNIDVELFVRNSLQICHDRNAHLRLLCFQVPMADDKMINKLEEMIHIEKLLLDFTIKRVVDNIYLQWI